MQGIYILHKTADSVVLLCSVLKAICFSSNKTYNTSHTMDLYYAPSWRLNLNRRCFYSINIKDLHRLNFSSACGDVQVYFKTP